MKCIRARKSYTQSTCALGSETQSEKELPEKEIEGCGCGALIRTRSSICWETGVQVSGDTAL
jgi:hypothetical protein